MRLLIGLHIGFLLICAIFLSVSLSMLSDSKTATGVISIEMPPTISVGSGNLYFDRADSTMYLGQDSSGNAISADTTKSAKLVLVDTVSSTSAYVKIKLSLLGQENVLNFDSGSSVVFSDSTAMTSSVQNGVITLTSGAVAEYSYLFLDTIFSKIRINETITNEIVNATMQVQITVSLNQDFSNAKTTSIYYNFNCSSLEATINLPSGDGYTATAVTQNPIIGQEYEFTVTLSSGYDKTEPIVEFNGETLQSISVSGNTYTYKITITQATVNITVSVVQNTTSIITIKDPINPLPEFTQEVAIGVYLRRSGTGVYLCETDSGTGTLIHAGSHSNMQAQSIKFNGVEMEEGIYYEITGDITIEISNYKMEK